jgi:hypothetical protein
LAVTTVEELAIDSKTLFLKIGWPIEQQQNL